MRKEQLIDYKLIGEKIKQERKNKKLTQQQMSEKLGVSEVFLSHIERGNAKIDLEILVQISQILSIGIEELITGTQTKEEIYLDKDLKNVLLTCSLEKQKLIYNVAKIIAGINFDKKN